MDKFVHTDIICFSHLRWYFVYQRPQHLLSRFVAKQRVFFWEEPITGTAQDHIEVRKDESSGVWIITPHVRSTAEEEMIAAQKILVEELIEKFKIRHFTCWYYSPLALSFTGHLQPEVIIYDCMDELSAFRFAPKELKRMETLLLDRTDIVFTGGRSLYEARQHLHPNIHCFPSSIDKEHFAKARERQADPEDMRNIPHPRIGFYGVIDERFNMSLLQQLATHHPEWHFIIVGPTAKIDPEKLPVQENIHFTGPRNYRQLPQYLASWDIAMMPFALNESTKYISPTKTPEYLAGGKPVVSTSIRDVVNPYGNQDLVYIADTVNEFSDAIRHAIQNPGDKDWLQRVDAFLENISWDITFKEMNEQINKTWDIKKGGREPDKIQAYV